jgi:hypothetical protein
MLIVICEISWNSKATIATSHPMALNLKAERREPSGNHSLRICGHSKLTGVLAHFRFHTCNANGVG